MSFGDEEEMCNVGGWIYILDDVVFWCCIDWICKITKDTWFGATRGTGRKEEISSVF